MKRDRACDLGGSLEHFAVDLVLQWLAQARASGCLSVQHGRERLRVYLVRGRIVGAVRGRKAAGDRPQEAIASALAWREGSFEYVHGLRLKAPTCDLAVDEVLLACLTQADRAKSEQAHHA